MDIKERHRLSPKYVYQEKPQSDVIQSTGTEVISVTAQYAQSPDRKSRISQGNCLYTVEQFARRYFEDRGYEVLETESRPFHVIFGVFMWSLIQDTNDPLVRVVGFGSRSDFDRRIDQPKAIDTFLPTDFGTKGYFDRRQDAIEAHLDQMRDLRSSFFQELASSEGLRQYLWAHQSEDIERAHALIQVLTDSDLKKILRYLIQSYWHNFCGWPDLFVHKGSDLLFVEVKSSNDKLSEDQKNWLTGNKKHLGFPTKIFKVCKR